MSSRYLTRNEVAARYCAIGSVAYHGRNEYAQPNDGFCSECQMSTASGRFECTSEIMDYVLEAVLEKLVRDKKLRNVDPMISEWRESEDEVLQWAGEAMHRFVNGLKFLKNVKKESE